MFSDSGFQGIASNSVFTGGVVAFAIAQLMKVFTHWYVLLNGLSCISTLAPFAFNLVAHLLYCYYLHHLSTVAFAAVVVGYILGCAVLNMYPVHCC